MREELFLVLRGLPGPWRSAFRLGILSHLAHGSPSASRARLCHRSLHLGVSRGRPWCPPSLLRQVLRVRKGKAANAAHVSIWPTAAPLVRNSPRGWTPRSLTTIRLSGRRAVAWCRRRPRPFSEHQGDAEAVPGTWLPITFIGPVTACLPTMLSRALARPTRASGSGRVFGAHPRGEFRTSERPQAT
jgi:hypothetical protein